MVASVSAWWRAAVAVAAVCAGGARAKGIIDDDMAELAAMVRESCAAETAVDLALIDSVNGGADLMPDAALKCYMKCVMETAGMYSEGVVDEEALLAMLPGDMRPVLEPHIRACGTRTGADHCDTAWLTQVCWQKADKSSYYLI